jgi:HNH endonuclease
MVANKVDWLKRNGYDLKKSEWFEQNKSGKLKKGCGIGATSRFQKGAVPFNKGTKGFMKSYETSFKKGIRPHNTVSVGTIVKCAGNSGKYTYLRIKVAEPSKWELLHRWVWQQNFGEIPKGCIVKFKDGNYENCEPENLYLQDRQGNMKQNSIHNYPKEVFEIAKLLGRLKSSLTKKKKEING